MTEVVNLFVRPAQLVASGVVPSKTTLWRWVAEGRFPKPIMLGPQARAFRKADVDRWFAERESAEPIPRGRPRNAT